MVGGTGGREEGKKYSRKRGLQLFSEKKKRIKNNQRTCRPSLLFKAAGLWSQAGSAGKSRPGARPGQGCAAAGQNSPVVPEKRWATSGKHPLLPPARPGPRFQGSLSGQTPPPFFLPLGSDAEGGPPRGACPGGQAPFAAAHAAPRGSPAGTALLRDSGASLRAGLAQPGGPDAALHTLPPRDCGNGHPALAAPSGLQSTTKSVRFYFLQSSLLGAFSRQCD